MSRLWPLFPEVVDVLAHARAPVPPPVVLPEVGLRWGQPSQFEFGMEPEPSSAEAGAVILRQVHEPRIIKGIESHRQYEEHTPLASVTVEGIKSATFFLGEREVVHESREVDGRVTYVETVIETIEEYVKFDFNFEAMGDRGTPHPPETIGIEDLGDFDLEPFDLDR